MINKNWTDVTRFAMAGTEGTGAYVVVLETALGRVGYRDLRGGTYRLRIEPANDDAAIRLAASFKRADGYKQPGDSGQPRFSTMVFGGESQLRTVLGNAIGALVEGVSAVNANGPDWAQELVASAAKQTLVAKARTLKVAGANRRWTLATLTAKIAAASAETPGEERARLVAAIKAKKVPGANLASRWSLDTLRAKAQA